jgi:hypothetical protein
MSEIWKPIKIVEYDHYEVSNTGLVRNKRKQILKFCLRNGYQSFTISKNNTKKTENIHRLIAITFLPNTNNLPIVNHIDGNKLNNHIDNLEWCTYKENTSHALTTKLTKPSTKSVTQYSYDGKELIKTFDSIRQAENETGIGNRIISQVCKGQKPTATGFRWKYTNDFQFINPLEVIGENIPGFNNYIITRDGQVYSIRSKKYLVQNPSNVYFYIKLCNNGIKKDFYVHVLVAKSFIPNPQNKSFVNHKNSNKKDNNINNLEWVTASENAIHSIKTRQTVIEV